MNNVLDMREWRAKLENKKLKEMLREAERRAEEDKEIENE